ncbi:MAG: ATP-binding cassette domain-containing protein [Pseudomonadota bacterium]
MIRFEHVSVRYAASAAPALSDVSFEMPAGAMGFLTGPSGAGKSTLIKLCNAVVLPSGGRVTVGEQDLAALDRQTLPGFRRQIGTVYQNNTLLDDRNVHDNVALPLDLVGMARADADPRVRAALEKVGLGHAAHSAPSHLSGGEQQRVAIARAVVSRPAVLIADEPTGNLDRELSREIMRLFWELNQVGVTVLVATHDEYMVEQMEMPVITLEAGTLTHNGFEVEAA